ncbi:MAG: hypothetical protein HXY34_04035, partial [Candidatus Thorarchaeota archaeon]|nr:hypothetical protein [Candidatus Thorarchaeota archaeon]
LLAPHPCIAPVHERHALLVLVGQANAGRARDVGALDELALHRELVPAGISSFDAAAA